ncbi:hypothetical protein GLAREA_12038 [Glarea lozoyensis ATCC 20868]|uniref:Uncharacterized protein n=1 Tax=Glarea lozoyensis (strain ATCC 20868 / MF5171) TaxID=1116229 RepID=S3DIU6_GLAL2|nr:uncharacterized protein GLAREA_12038 [Glarea lozoyensis ATCC 20868]EPE31956.1 hypothetical protein GLAREA_12038 [Glarea lozoyensis ATCC 20868]
MPKQELEMWWTNPNGCYCEDTSPRGPEIPLRDLMVCGRQNFAELVWTTMSVREWSVLRLTRGKVLELSGQHDFQKISWAKAVPRISRRKGKQRT